jgi:hypothetical protein
MLCLVAIIRNYPKITLVGPTLRHLYPPQIKTILWLSAVVPTDVVWVLELALCTLKLLVRVFTPLPDRSEKTQNPGSDILNLGSRKFLYITVDSFGSGGRGGRGRFLYPPLVQWERDVIRPSFLSFGRLWCFVEIRSWFVHLAGAETVVVARCCTGLSLPHPPKLLSVADAETVMVARCFTDLSFPHPPKLSSQTDTVSLFVSLSRFWNPYYF